MIDLKLNDMPVDPEDDIANTPETASSTEQRAARAKSGRAGLSINDTVASNANLSVGGRGVDTSGVKSGTGAGGGMTMTTAGSAGESPSPEIRSGVRGTGTTSLGSNDAVPVGSTMPAGVDIEGDSSGPGDLTGSQRFAGSDDLTGHEDAISRRAYDAWCERGCPDGSPEVDWHRAVEEHRMSGSGLAKSAKA